jgi:cellobiose-specific phosphotransferase system component IIA
MNKPQLIVLEGDEYPSLGDFGIGEAVVAIIGVVTTVTIAIISNITNAKNRQIAALQSATAAGVAQRQMQIQSTNAVLSAALQKSILEKESIVTETKNTQTNKNLMIAGGCLVGAMLLKPKSKKGKKK